MRDILSRLKSALADRYTIERELGRGAFGTVYLARDLLIDRPVALKQIRGKGERLSEEVREEILAEAEMLVTDVDPDIAADTRPTAVVKPGSYILQAGSFSTSEDADKRRAELALQGIESHIQRVKVNDRDYHRVYVGPTDDLDELNMLRSRLRVAQIDVLRIRLGD